MELVQALRRVLDAQPELVYGFVATADGDVVGEAGRRARLRDTGVIDIAARPESIRAFVEMIRASAREDPRLVPRLYSQGRTYGVLGEPAPGVLLAVFGAMPAAVYRSGPRARVEWIAGFRDRTWAAVVAVWQP
jgi:hypothetical protein